MRLYAFLSAVFVRFCPDKGELFPKRRYFLILGYTHYDGVGGRLLELFNFSRAIHRISRRSPDKTHAKSFHVCLARWGRGLTKDTNPCILFMFTISIIIQNNNK